MLLITHLDVWMLTGNVTKPGIGNQSLYNTLLGYARAGYEVHMLTTSTALAGMPPIHPRVVIHRRPLRLHHAYSRAKRLARRILSPLRSATTTSALPATEADFSNQNVWRFSRLFAHVMGRRAIALARRLGGVEFVYGHEFLGALAGERSAKALNVPLVTRFQGTELSQFLDQPERLLACRAHVAAYKTAADLIIMANDGTRGDQVLELLGIGKDRYRFYMNGVVKDDVYRPEVDVVGIRRQLGIERDHLFVLYTGRMFYWKRIDRHLEVIRRARQTYTRFVTVLIGDGPEFAACRRLSASLGLDDAVRFLGPLPHSEVMDYLNACDVYISFHDLTNLCNPVIEACVCGKCIVTTNVGGTTDLLTDHVDAIVLDKHDDVDAIGATLANVLEDSVLRARLAEGAFRRGASLRTWEERMRLEADEVAKLLTA